MRSDPHSETDAKRLVLDFSDLTFVQREAGQAAERYLARAIRSTTRRRPTARRSSRN